MDDGKDTPSHEAILVQAQENADGIQKNSDGIADLRSQLLELTEQTESSRAFFADMATAGRVGRLIRHSVTWLLLLSGAFAFVWITVGNAIENS
jgi:hypothetical protein